MPAIPLSVPVWRAGQPATADLPAGRYQFVYLVPAPLAALALAEAELKKGHEYADGNGNRATLTGYHVGVRNPWTATMTLDVDIVGAPVAVVVIIIAAIALGVGAVSVFTFASLKEVRAIAVTPAGQKVLGATAAGVGLSAVLLPVLVLAVIAGGAWLALKKGAV